MALPAAGAVEAPFSHEWNCSLADGEHDVLLVAVGVCPRSRHPLGPGMRRLWRGEAGPANPAALSLGAGVRRGEMLIPPPDGDGWRRMPSITAAGVLGVAPSPKTKSFT